MERKETLSVSAGCGNLTSSIAAIFLVLSA